MSSRRVAIFLSVVWALTAPPSTPWSQTRSSPPGGSAGSETAVLELLRRAELLRETGQTEPAISVYQQILNEYPETSFRDRVYRRLGQSYLDKGDPAAAVKTFETFLREFPVSPDLPSVLDELAEAYLERGDLEKAASSLVRERSLLRDAAQKKNLTDRLVRILLQKRDHVEAVENLLLMQKWVSEEEGESLQDRIAEIIQMSRMEEATQFVKRYPRGFPGDFALLRLAELEKTQGLLFEAERDFRRFLGRFPKHPEKDSARSQLEAIKEQLLQNRFLIGAALPLSGRFQPFSEQVINGIRLAVDRFQPAAASGSAGKLAGIVVRDTGAVQGGVGSAIDDLVREYRVIAVIGPLMSSEVPAAADRAEHHRIPVITPSASAPALPAEGLYFFRNAITLRNQGRFMAEYAMVQLGLKRFAILYPDDAYGRELAAAFSTYLRERDGEVIDVRPYPTDGIDFSDVIRRLKDADLKKYGTLEPPTSQEGQTQEYKPGIDAIYLPGDYDQVGLIAAQLAFYDFKNVALLGSNGWHGEDIIRIGGRYVEGAVFVDGFFPQTQDPSVRDFVTAYRGRYGEAPGLLAAQAFDSTMIVLKALAEGATTAEQVRDFLEKLDRFPGVSGKISAGADGELDRPLHVIQVKNGRFVELK